MTKLKTMTSGNIYRIIINFTIPIMLGNLFQLLYNTIDSIIVGRYVGFEALAAVGSTSPLINLIVGFFMGIAAGAGVLVSRYFGSKNQEKLSICIHTFIKLSIYVSILLTFFGIFFSKFLLELFNTPADIINDSTLYLQVYFAGISGLVIYNSASGILRAVGDSKTPLYFLLLSSVINVILDLVFVVYFNLGVFGVGLATLIAQATSAILIIYKFIKTNDVYKLSIHKLKIDRMMLNKILSIGIPSGIQQAIVSFSNVLVQSYVNGFGSYVIAGYSAANKIDAFVFMPINSLSLTITTFVGQNAGANNIKRAFKGVNASLILLLISCVVITLITVTNCQYLVGLFNDNKHVIKYGVQIINILSPLYFIFGIGAIYLGAIRGFGYTKVPMYINVFCLCICRQIFLYFVMTYKPDVQLLFWCYPLTWLILMILSIIYYFKGSFRNSLKENL